jgi:5'-nucleotidase
MSRPLGHIRILISARVLFDLEEADALFKEKGEREYADYMRGRGKYEKDFVPELGGRALEKGPLWDFAVAALALNKEGKEPVVEVGLLCKDSSETVVPIFRNLDMNGLSGIGYRMATAGNKIDMSHHEMFGTDVLLTRNAEDVQLAVNNDIAAAVINFPPAGTTYSRKPGNALQIFVDGDAVAVGSSSEVFYRERGLGAYRDHEARNFDQAMEPGPFTAFLAKVSALNAKFSAAEQPFKISLLTARGNDATTHIAEAAEKLGINFNGTLYFMSGASKAPVLKAQRPDIFFDDQAVHLEESLRYCPTGLVAYPKDSPMDLFQKEKETITKRAVRAHRSSPRNRPPQPS